ncbi:hypothetical protein CLOBOL_05164 [Enterocloster bolteae ATCC BAA-613]|uniref:Uncharacterized protein n=1 Tax=Enterocloster bolteae (strain ATCC BAA-613 / DSM 15670 / CCUG 46953 / JCM 12243 / WAL 16351) TaxID=411902 RepID=A8RYM0_ENTBW|nr:hypothetical protein CLOBOL_05164 [Enterocloster bolteae ATCC BAA-613]
MILPYSYSPFMGLRNVSEFIRSGAFILLGILSHIYKNARFLTKIAFFVKILTDCKIILCGI